MRVACRLWADRSPVTNEFCSRLLLIAPALRSSGQRSIAGAAFLCYSNAKQPMRNPRVRRNRVGNKAHVFLGILFLALLFAAGICRAQSVNLGYSGTGVSGTLRRIIEKEKLWQKRSLDVKSVYFNSGNVLAQAVVAWDILVSDSDVPGSLTPKISGIRDVRAIAVTINRLE